MPWLGFRQGENWRKRLYFHRAVEMKQPHTMTMPFVLSIRKWGCLAAEDKKVVSWKMVDVFSLKLQRNNQQNALARVPPGGKLEKKVCIFRRTVEMKQSHTMTEPTKKSPEQHSGLFCFSVIGYVQRLTPRQPTARVCAGGHGHTGRKDTRS